MLWDYKTEKNMKVIGKREEKLIPFIKNQFGASFPPCRRNLILGPFSLKSPQSQTTQTYNFTLVQELSYAFVNAHCTEYIMAIKKCVILYVHVC